MKVIDVKTLRGPNYWSIKKHKIIQLTLDLEDLEYKPTNKIPGFFERLSQLMTSLHEHQCGVGKPGGFFERVKEGTWMGHVIEHIAIELQILAGINVAFGQTRGTGKEGIYHVAFEYGEEQEGLYAMKAAIRIAEALISDIPYDIQPDIKEIKRLWYAHKMGPSTASIAMEAQKRNIPVMRLDEDALVQLGYGSKAHRIEATITSHTSSLGVDIAGNKALTKKLLAAANLAVPMGEVISHEEKLNQVIETLGFPLVIKPLNGNHGNGATINILDEAHALCAFRRAKNYSDEVIVEKFIEGNDYRILVINYKFVAASLRTPASVTGNGEHSIETLIEIENKDPRRGHGHTNTLTKIKADEVTMELLKKKGYTLNTILPKGEIFYIKPTANLSTGGTATDVTDNIHPQNIFCFERIARTIGLDICGIDIMASTLERPLKETGGAILEVNAAPGFRMHLEPTSGQPRNVAAPVVDMLFPGQENGRIPIIAITGTNGKTTTTRLIAHIVNQAGFTMGFTTTDGVYINGEQIMKGDCTGPQSAQMVLRDSAVEFAVLETARGGLLRSGLGFDKCDCAIVTNVAEDHLGMAGIDSIEKLAKVKSIVPESVQPGGYAILNADDDLVYGMREAVKCNVALFSMHANNYRIEEHCANGGLAAVYENGYLLIRNGNHIIPVEEAVNFPITFGGKAEFNIANTLAAVLAAYTCNISLGVIQNAMRSFMPSHETTPGRVNVYTFNEFTVILDYAHNPHGVKALGNFVKSFNGTKIGIITGVGDRRDTDIIALGEEAAKVFDEIVIRHDDDLRGRTYDEIDRLLHKGIQKVDSSKPVSYYGKECEALEKILYGEKKAAVIVMLADNVTAATECILKYKQKTMQYV